MSIKAASMSCVEKIVAIARLYPRSMFDTRADPMAARQVDRSFRAVVWDQTVELHRCARPLGDDILEQTIDELNRLVGTLGHARYVSGLQISELAKLPGDPFFNAFCAVKEAIEDFTQLTRLLGLPPVRSTGTDSLTAHEKAVWDALRPEGSTLKDLAIAMGYPPHKAGCECMRQTVNTLRRKLGIPIKHQRGVGYIKPSLPR